MTDQDLATDDDRIAALRSEADRTRMQMSGTIQALEDKLNPRDLIEVAANKLEDVEKHVRAAVREELLEVKAILKEEIHEAKMAVNEVIENAKVAVKEDAIAISASVKQDAIDLKDSVKEDVIAAKDAVKEDVRQAIADAKNSARAATLGQLENFATQAGDAMNTTKDTLVDTIRQNPIPAALMGVGLAWLLMNRSSAASQRRARSERGRDYDRSFDRGYDGRDNNGRGRPESGMQRRVDHEAMNAGGALRKAKDATSAALGQAADGVSHLASDVRDQASDLAHRAADGASNMAHDAAEATSHLWNDASDASERAYQRVSSTMSDVAHEIPRQARRAERAAGSMYTDNPLAVGAAVLAAGALLGMALPRTDREDALLGETRDQFLVSAKQAAQGALETVQHMGEDAAQNVRGALAERAEV